MKRNLIAFFLIALISICGAEETKEILISNVFVETDLRQALRDISAQAGIPIIPDSLVQGVVSVEFYDVPLEKCLEMLLTPLGFAFRKIQDYYIVTSTDPRSPSFELISRTEKIELNHIKAVDAVYNLPTFLLAYIKVNQDKNIMTITAPEKTIERIKEEIAILDRPSKQVSIEVLVTELTDDAIDKVGLGWGEEYSVNVSGEFGVIETSSAYQLIGELAKQVLLSIQMMARKGEVKVRAKPMIIAADTEEATIEIGTDKYVVLETGTVDSTYNRLQSVSAGIKLKIVPYISESNEITLEIETEVSDILPGTAEDVKLSVSRRSAETTVHLKDGQTVGIGGLVQENQEERTSKVPLLGDIPILGRLFRTKKNVSTKTELIIFITPRIVDPESMNVELADPTLLKEAETSEDEKVDESIGLDVSFETGLVDVNQESRVFYIIPEFSYEFFHTGFSMGSRWEIPLIPAQNDVGAVLFERFGYELENAPISIFAGNINTFYLDSKDVNGYAHLGSIFSDIFSTEFIFGYLPEMSLTVGVGIGHVFNFDGGFTIGIRGRTNIEILNDPGLNETVITNSYSYAFEHATLTIVVESEIDFRDETGVGFGIAPYASFDLSL
jgi:type IV pilus assembly protein PilQ